MSFFVEVTERIKVVDYGENWIIAIGLLSSAAYIIMKFYMEGEEPTTPETPVETPTEEGTKEGE